MTVTINGEQRDVPERSTLADALQRCGYPGAGVAVAVDGVVVPRASWPDTRLATGMTIEILTAVQGG